MTNPSHKEWIRSLSNQLRYDPDNLWQHCCSEWSRLADPQRRSVYHKSDKVGDTKPLVVLPGVAAAFHLRASLRHHVLRLHGAILLAERFGASTPLSMRSAARISAARSPRPAAGLERAVKAWGIRRGRLRLSKRKSPPPPDGPRKRWQ